MRNFIAAILWMLLVIPIIAQNKNDEQKGGLYLPSEGNLHALFIFVQFPDDQFDPENEGWIKGQPPARMKTWVDEHWSQSAQPPTLTDYFNEMSFNKLKFTGKTFSVITPHSRKWYLENNKKRFDIHKEVIEELDKSFNFEQFDNWDYEAPYTHINRPDSVVDLMFMIWRNIEHDFPDSGINKSLQIYRDAYLNHSFTSTPIVVDNGKRRIETGIFPNENNPGGSGATLVDHFNENMFRFVLHEFGHYLQGANSEHTGYGFWGLCSGWGIKCMVPNSYERYRLGWIDVETIEIESDTTFQISLRDYVTTGNCFRIKPNKKAFEYFFIENHQSSSYWENNQLYGKVEQGIYVIRQDAIYAGSQQLIAADGRFSWEVKQEFDSPWGRLPVFKKVRANRKWGYHDLQFIPWSINDKHNPAAPIHYIENEHTGKPELNVKYGGDGKDAFRLGYNEVFTPYSNPNSQDARREPTPFGFQLLDEKDGVYTLEVYFNTSLQAPPSKPNGLFITSKEDTVMLSWEPNIEPDMKQGGKYKIYRSVFQTEEADNYELIETIDASNVSIHYIEWRDPDPVIDNKKKIFYKVLAVDNEGKESLPSEPVALN